MLLPLLRIQRKMKVCILTVSDTRTKENDISGKWIQDFLSAKDFFVVQVDIVKDEKESIQERLIDYSDNLKVDIVLTTGGTGFSPRDITPEATKKIVERDVPGLSEYLRSQGARQTKRAVLSRGCSGIRKKTLIINLPGSLDGVKDALDNLIDILPHAIEMLKGKGH